MVFLSRNNLQQKTDEVQHKVVANGGSVHLGAVVLSTPGAAGSPASVPRAVADSSATASGDGFSLTAVAAALPTPVTPTSTASLATTSLPASSPATSNVFAAVVSSTAASGPTVDTLGMFGQASSAVCMTLWPGSAIASLCKDVIS